MGSLRISRNYKRIGQARVPEPWPKTSHGPRTWPPLLWFLGILRLPMDLQRMSTGPKLLIWKHCRGGFDRRDCLRKSTWPIILRHSSAGVPLWPTIVHTGPDKAPTLLCLYWLLRNSAFKAVVLSDDFRSRRGKLLNQVVAGGFYNMWMANVFKRMGGQYILFWVGEAKAFNTTGAHNGGGLQLPLPKWGRPHLGNSLCAPLLLYALASAYFKSIGHPLSKMIDHRHIIKASCFKNCPVYKQISDDIARI
jgi:hypothetical protein